MGAWEKIDPGIPDFEWKDKLNKQMLALLERGIKAENLSNGAVTGGDPDAGNGLALEAVQGLNIAPAAVGETHLSADLVQRIFYYLDGHTRYYQDAAPVGGSYTHDDIWFDTDDNWKPYTYDEATASWVAAPIDSPLLCVSTLITSFVSAGIITAAVVNAVTIAGNKIYFGDPDGAHGELYATGGIPYFDMYELQNIISTKSATNKVTNGSFVNTTGWTAFQLSTFSAASNEATMHRSGAGTYGQITSGNIAITSGHKYYAGLWVKDSTASSFFIYDGVSTSWLRPLHTGSGNYEHLSAIGTATNSTATGYMAFRSTNNTTDFYCKYAILLDLTEIFGAGNEPATKAEVETMLAYMDAVNLWFDGTVNLITAITPTPVKRSSWSFGGLNFLDAAGHVTRIATTVEDKTITVGAGKDFATPQDVEDSLPFFINHAIAVDIYSGTYTGGLNIYGHEGKGAITYKVHAGETVSIDYITVDSKCNILIRDMTLTSTERVCLCAYNCINLGVSNITISAAAAQAGIELIASKAFVSDCAVSNRIIGIWADSRSQVKIYNCSGSGNTTGLYCSDSLMHDAGNTITGTTPRTRVYGGLIVQERANAAQAQCPAGGTGAAAGAWDTAAHRDAAIALINEMRTVLINAGLMKGSS